MFAILDAANDMDINSFLQQAGLSGIYSSAPTTTGVTSLLFAVIATILFL